MDFSFTSEQQLIRESCKALLEIYKPKANMGLMAPRLPEEAGGAAVDADLERQPPTGRAGSVCAARIADLGAEVRRVLVADDPLPNELKAWREHSFASSHGRLLALHGDDVARRWQEQSAGADT